MKNKWLYKFEVVVTLMLTACTDLDAPVYDKLSNFWKTEAEINAGVGLPYRGLRGYTEPFSIYGVSELSTDEIIAPIRGSDWAETGLWDRMWKHTWTADHPIIENTWQFIFGNPDHGGIAPINLVIEELNKVDPSLAETVDRPKLIAEMKTLRAFYYYLGLDLFSDIPIVTSNDFTLSQLDGKFRSEVFAFAEKELTENMDLLSSEKNSKTYGKATRWFGLSVLAKMYLNAEVYTGVARWAECIDLCDEILNSGKYSLEENYFANFSIRNEGSKENIFVIPYDFQEGLHIFVIQGFTLHYQSGETFGLAGGGVNGFCSNKGFVDLFSSNDLRKKMFLIGQQYLNSKQYETAVADPDNLQYDNGSGLPLFFELEMPTFSSTRTAGARCVKWELNDIGAMDNDFAVFRLADIILMKAEAQLRNGDAEGALQTINQKINRVSIRSRAGLEDFTLSELTLENLLKERACELAWEGHRRNDLIRFGHFTDARIPEKLESEDFRTVFPIPRAELDKNPYLKQNEGY